ncbi:MAG: hypothetical protein NTW90_02965 [Nitrosospira sp.]|nr:hypothetical protein [Nitrosospira sp.]
MVSRRQFCTGVGASVIAASIAPNVVANMLSAANPLALPMQIGKKLDMAAAQSILSEDIPLLRHKGRDVWLYLSEYSDYSQDALAYLVGNIGEIEGIEAGFRCLSKDGAHTITQLRTQFCFLTGLGRLDEEAAVILGDWDREFRPIQDIVIQEPLSVEAASALVAASLQIKGDCCDGPLALSMPSINSDIAGALCHHNHELYLRIRDEQLLPGAAWELARHTGYSLTLDLDKAIPEESIRALVSNPEKRMKHITDREFNRVYLANPVMWNTFYDESHL